MDESIKELLYKIADDQLILGHRNSEWTGLGPLLEEDIAFSSMAQDKIGQCYAIYQILHAAGEPNPDSNAFLRSATNFKNCILVELPNGEYDFSLVRHFLYDTALSIRFEMLSNSTFEPIAELSRKVTGELRYHTLHANTWIKKLGSATKESISRLQMSLDFAIPYALGIFEPSPFETDLISNGIFPGEQALETQWRQKIQSILSDTQLILPDLKVVQPIQGGRKGQHSVHLQPLLDEMSEVLRIDPNTEW
jgi:ring-1,2-phenylacetyl-CoA epoxidase subunit PaaC